MQTIAEILSKELNETLPHVQNVIELLDGGNTVPFIARYRKEMHGSMDDQQIRRLADRLTYLRNLDAMRKSNKEADHKTQTRTAAPSLFRTAKWEIAKQEAAVNGQDEQATPTV